MGGIMSSNSHKPSEISRVNDHTREVNDSMYELHTSVSVPSMQVIFFHGLPLGDLSEAHSATWESGDGSCIWPQTWLVEEFPDAEIFSVSYSKCMKKASIGSFDMSILGEKLIDDLIGQLANCPIVLVGHCIGGLVIKQLCLQAHDKLHMASRSEKAKLEAFLDNVRGFFYYATPHFGSPNLVKAAEQMGSPLLEYIKILSSETARMNSRFEHLRRLHTKWHIRGLGESIKTKLGLFREDLLVPEASARGGEMFLMLPEDHYSICRPQSKSSTSFRALVQLLDNIMSNWKEEIKIRYELHQKEEAGAHEESQPAKLLHLPEKAVGIESRLEQVRSRLEKVKSLGMVGMVGVGKTTLAKAIFNEFSVDFDYNCFVPNVKSIKGTAYEAKEVMWKHKHYKGRKVGNEDAWSCMKGKKLLLVLDDIAEDRDVTIISYLAEYCSPESRFIATSRDREVLRGLDDIYQVPFLDPTDSQELFMTHAFPNSAEMPHKLAKFMVDVVRRCNGLPLLLAVLGNLLRKKEVDEYWEQALQALGQGEGLRAMLRLSYDDLQETEKKMFLDATTFFNNGQFSLREAKAAWRIAYGTSSEDSFWRTLVNRSLVEDVEEDETIKVHEECQHLGQIIAAEYSKRGPCRVWEQPTALRLLQYPDQKDTKEIYSLQIEINARVDIAVIHIASPALRKLEQLRFLNINGSVVIDGSQEDDSLLQELVVLNCVGLQIFNLARKSRLVVLKLSSLNVETLPASFGQLSSLESFVLSGAEELRSLPAKFGELSRLTHLELISCASLQYLPDSFGELHRLKHLKISKCLSLRSLPDSFGCLSSLEKLRFLNCGRLRSLPESFGELSALDSLEFSNCGQLSTLPDSFGNLSALDRLSFKLCSLNSLPESFERLSMLRELKIIECDSMWSLIPFGQLMTLEYLKIKGAEMDTLPDSMAKLTALRHLILESVPTKSIPDFIEKMPSLHNVELATLPYVKALPAWLGNTGVIPLALSHKIFQMHEGCFSLIYEKGTISSDRLVRSLHLNAMMKVREGDFQGALADLCPGDLGEVELEWEGFLLQERGIAKRLIGDLGGALEDLTAALEDFSQANDLWCYGYDCWKHRGYVNFLLGDLDGAENDGKMALNHLSLYKSHPGIYSSLGYESVLYMHFKLKGMKEMREEGEDLDLAHHDVMEKVKAEDFAAALAMWNVLDAKASGCHNRVYFLQERGILKRMLGDLPGALEDLTSALEIDEDAYECLKHRAFVKSLMLDLDGARLDAERCIAMKRNKDKPESLGALPLEFLEFEFNGADDVESMTEEPAPVAPQHTAVELLPDPTHSTCNRSVEQLGSNLLHATGQLSELVEEFIAEIKQRNSDGFFVRGEWLHNLQENEREVLMLVLRGAGFSEVDYTSTTILYKKLDQDNADVSNPTVCNDPSFAGYFSDPTRLTILPAQEEIQSSSNVTDMKANNDCNLSSLEGEGKEELSTPAEQLSTDMGSFIAALKEKGLRSYSVSTEWLSELKDNEQTMLKSICTENGYQIHPTGSQTYFEKIEGHVCTCSDGSKNADNDACRPVDTATTSGEQKKRSDLHPKDQESLERDDKDDEDDGMTHSIPPRPKSDVTRCIPQLLKVTCRPTRSRTGASTSSQDLTPPENRVGPRCGDSSVDLPLPEAYRIATKVEQTFGRPYYIWRGTELIKEDISLQVFAESTVSCCLRSDNADTVVHVKFSKLKGQIKEVAGPRIPALVLQSVRTNVDAGIYLGDSDSKTELVELDLPNRRRVDDGVWLARSEVGPSSAPCGSLDFELRRDKSAPCGSLDFELRRDKRRGDEVRSSLLFYNPKSPVTLEGGIPVFSGEQSLKLFVRYQLVISYPEACGQTNKPWARTVDVTWPVDLDCVLNYRAQSCFRTDRPDVEGSRCTLM